MGDSEVIVILDDEPTEDLTRGTPGSVNIIVEEEDDGEIQVVEATCNACGAPSAEGSPVLTLASCRHTAHYGCCITKEFALTASPATRKRRKPTNSPEVQVPSESLCCPRCSAELEWSDHATALERKAYLEYGSSIKQADEKPLSEAIYVLLTMWKTQVNSTPAKGKKASAPKGRAAAMRAAVLGAGSTAWAGGTGYGGNANEKVSLAAIEKSQKNQKKVDETIGKSLEPLRVILAELARHQPSTEALLRERIDDGTSDPALALTSLFSSYLINGPADVVLRFQLYKQLFAILELIAKSACLMPLLVSNTVLPIKEGSGCDSDGETLLVRLNRLMEGLREMSGDAEGQLALQLADQAHQIKQAALANVSKHPHFRSQATSIQSQVQAGRALWRQKRAEAEKLALSDTATAQELEKAYKASLAPIQFRAISLLELCGSGRAAHSFVRKDPNTKSVVVTSGSSGTVPDPSRMGRIRKEIASLKSSMPLEWNSSIFCAVDETRPDVLQFLIIGPEGTPYQNGCFLFDCCLSPSFPSTPPLVMIQTTGGGQVRFNPNLYKDGKVCLSLLGTWSGPGWDPKTSTLLQVLVSIQSLILVSDPYFNEPGFEASMKTPQGQLASEVYNANLRYHTVRLAITQALLTPPYAFEQVIKTHFTLKRKEISQQLAAWKDDLKKTLNKVATSASTSHYLHFAASGGGGAPDPERFDFSCDQAVQAMNRLVTTGSAASAAIPGASSSSSSYLMPLVPLPAELDMSMIQEPEDDEDDEDDDEEEEDDDYGEGGVGDMFQLMFDMNGVGDDDDEEEVVDLT